MQNNPKGNRLPFATAPKVICALIANCQRATEHRIQYTFNFLGYFWILQAVAETLLHAAKRNWKPFGAETKGGKYIFVFLFSVLTDCTLYDHLFILNHIMR
jgi:hypothetical protein